MIATLRYVLLTALRDRLFPVLLAFMLAALGLARFLVDASIAEGTELALAYAGGATRLILVAGLIIFIAFHVRRMMETREIEAILSRPISREAVILAYWLGFSLVMLPLAAAITAAIGLTIGGTPAGLALWGYSQALEGFIVVAFALFAALTLPSAVASSLTAFGFYLLGRLVIFFLDISEKGGQIVESVQTVNEIVKWLMTGIAMALPRLDLFGQTRWLIYGPGSEWLTLTLQTAVYVPLLLAAAMLDLRRKRF